LNDKEQLWKRYELSINTYLKYLDFVLKLNLFYYGITGALVSFYFAKSNNNTLIEYALILPIIFSIGIIALCVFASKTLNVSKKEIDWLTHKDQLNLNYVTRIDALIYLVHATAVFAALVAMGIGYILASRNL
jgi:hypothetical protein